MDKLMGSDFRAIVDGKQPCFKFFILGGCDAQCNRSHKLTKQPTAGMINGIKTRMRAGIDQFVADKATKPLFKNKTYVRDKKAKEAEPAAAESPSED